MTIGAAVVRAAIGRGTTTQIGILARVIWTPDPVGNAAEKFAARALALLAARCTNARHQPAELGFHSWIEDEMRPLGFRQFRSLPDVWNEEKVCAVEELGRIREEGGRSEYLSLIDKLKADAV